MNNLGQKIFSGAIALFSIGALISLEHHVAADQSLPVLLTIIAAGVCRFYLFIEGSQLSKHSAKDGKTAFALSIIITVMFLAYVGVIFWDDMKLAKTAAEAGREYTQRVPVYIVSLFVVSTLGATFVEWVFSRRVSYDKSTAEQGHEAKILQLQAELKDYRQRLDNANSERSKQSARIKALETQYKAAHDEIGKLKPVAERVEAHEVELEEIRPQAAKWAQISDMVNTFFKQDGDNTLSYIEVSKEGRRLHRVRRGSTSHITLSDGTVVEVPREVVSLN